MKKKAGPTRSGPVEEIVATRGFSATGCGAARLQGVTVAVMEDARLPSLVTVVNPLGVDTLTVVG